MVMTITALKSVFIGAGGTLILAVFCSTFLTIEKVLFITPAFLAFNGALTGFRLVELLKNDIHNIPLFSTVLGIGCGALVFIAVNLAGTFVKTGIYLSVYDVLIYICVSGVMSYLGAKLAARYFRL